MIGVYLFGQTLYFRGQWVRSAMLALCRCMHEHKAEEAVLENAEGSLIEWWSNIDAENMY